VYKLRLAGRADYFGETTLPYVKESALKGGHSVLPAFHAKQLVQARLKAPRTKPPPRVVNTIVQSAIPEKTDQKPHNKVVGGYPKRNRRSLKPADTREEICRRHRPKRGKQRGSHGYHRFFHYAVRASTKIYRFRAFSSKNSIV